MPRTRTGARRPPEHASDVFDQVVSRTNTPRAIVVEEWGERAAIRQYLGGMTKIQAERYAVTDAEQVCAQRSGLLKLPF